MRTRNAISYFFLPIAGLLGIYVFLAWFISDLIFDQPAPQIGTLIKYVISIVADWMDFPLLHFSLPSEWEKWILWKYPDFPRQYIVRDFHLLLDYLDKPIFYKVFPYYFFTSIVLCLMLSKKHAKKKDQTLEAKKEDKYSRGARQISSEEFCEKIREEVEDPAAFVETDGGNLVFSGNRMREHMSVFGASGTGKSQFLLSFLSSFFEHKKQGTRVIIVDRKGEFFSYFREKEDIIYNPFDERSVKWSLFNELEIPENLNRIPPDIWAISNILFPKPKNADPFWQDAAAKVFCSAVVSCIREGKTKNQDLVNFCYQDWKTVVKAMSSLPPGLDTGRVVAANETTGGSILSMAQNGVQKLSVCPDGDFSIRKWIHNGRGNLYLSSAGKNDSVFIPILSLMIDLIGREMKEMPDGGAGGVRYLILIDELAAYPAMQTLHYLVAEARSKGVSVVIATQTIQKLLKTYGNQDGKDIVANTKCKVLFKMGEEEDATYLSKTIGTAEIQRTQCSENGSSFLSIFSNQDRKTKTKQVIQETVFLPSDLMMMPTGSAVVLHPSAGETVAKIQFAPFHGSKHDIEFIPIQEKTVEARDFAELEKRKALEEEERQKRDHLRKRAEFARKREVERKKREAEMNESLLKMEREVEEPKEIEENRGYDDYLL